MQSTRWQLYSSKTPQGQLAQAEHKMHRERERERDHQVGATAVRLLVCIPRILVVPAIQACIGILWIMLWALSASFLISQVPDGYTPKASRDPKGPEGSRRDEAFRRLKDVRRHVFRAAVHTSSCAKGAYLTYEEAYGTVTCAKALVGEGMNTFSADKSPLFPIVFPTIIAF